MSLYSGHKLKGIFSVIPWIFKGRNKGGLWSPKFATISLYSLNTQSLKSLSYIFSQLGHQDFYPNGGTDMPNCYFSIICDHMKAIAYYTESISKGTPCRFRPTTWAPKWANYKKGIQTRDCQNMACSDMGYTASPTHDEGVFYLKTNKYYPFCQG